MNWDNKSNRLYAASSDATFANIDIPDEPRRRSLSYKKYPRSLGKTSAPHSSKVVFDIDDIHKDRFSSILAVNKRSSSMSATPSHTKTHVDPRISANDLARYMIAGEVGRKGIIRRSREVSTAVAARYSDARQALRASLCDKVNERRIIFAARDTFEQKADDPSTTDWWREDALKSMDVMDSFLGMTNQFASFDFAEFKGISSYVTISGVSVSVNCDILTRRPVKGVQSIGAGLFRLTKPEDDESDAAKSKRREMGAYAATLVHMLMSQNYGADEALRPDLCWSIDVQNTEIHKAPRNYRTRANNLETACEFIAAMWNRV